MTLISFPNKAKYRGAFYPPHVQIEVADVDVAEMVSKGAHVLQHIPDEVEDIPFEDVPDGEKEDAKEDDVPDSSEPLPDEDDDLGDEDSPVAVPPVEPEEKPSRRNQAKK